MIFTQKKRISKMNRMRFVGPTLVAACLSFGGSPATLIAQNEPTQAVRTLVIKNNQVLIDGREVDASELPKSLRLDSISVSYSFIGVDDPVVNLENQFFAVRPNRLEMIPGSFGVDAVGMMDKKPKSSLQDLSGAQGWIVDADNGEYYSFQGERLEANEAVPKLLNEANNLYLSGLQYRNQSLFSRLSKESTLEDEAAQLANKVRSAKSKTERDTQKKLLAEKLSEIFEFKQENRRAEIAQFERELAQLRERLERREVQKQRLIDHRLRLLLQNDENNGP